MLGLSLFGKSSLRAGAVSALMFVVLPQIASSQHRETPASNYVDLEFAASCFDNAKDAALAVAAASGDLQHIADLVAHGANPNARANNGMTPLMWSIQAGNKPGFERLLDLGARTDYVVQGDFFNKILGPQSRSLIGLASKKRDDSQWLEILLKHGANPNLVNPKIGDDDSVDYSAGTTPIFSAIDGGSLKNVDLLIDAGADLNHQDNRGNTPMMHAASHGRFDIVIRLLRDDADYRIKNNDGLDLAYEAAVFEQPVGVASDHARDCRSVIAFLQRKGVDIASARKRAEAERRNEY